jgi:hypothetical protein
MHPFFACINIVYTFRKDDFQDVLGHIISFLTFFYKKVFRSHKYLLSLHSKVNK